MLLFDSGGEEDGVWYMAVASGQAGLVLAGPVFMGHFWNCACTDNEILALAQLHRAVTRARTTPATGSITDSTARYPRNAISSN